MGEKPILFSAPMVRAIIAGTKTQTRRLVAHKVVSNGFSYDRELGDFLCHNDYLPPSELLMQVRTRREQYDVARCEGWELLCPHGQPGDRLYVREAWRTLAGLDDLSGSAMAERCLSAGYARPWAPIVYEADGERRDWLPFFDGQGIEIGRYRHARFMPRWASRLLLETGGQPRHPLYLRGDLQPMLWRAAS